MNKPCINLTIDRDLLNKLEQKRIDRINQEKKVISRSAYICGLLEKGLQK